MPVEFPGVAVVVVNYGASDLIESNLVPLTRAHPELVVAIVDNYSSNEERTRVSELVQREGWLLEAGDNVGFGAGMNAGVALAREGGADAFVLLNPDASIDAAGLGLLVHAVRADPLHLVAPVIRRPDGSVWFAGSDLYLTDGRIRSRRRRIAGAPVAEWLSGACLVVSWRLWEKVGGFAVDYFLYWEDVDLSWRVVRAGGTLRVIEEAAAVHAEGGTQSSQGQQHSGLPKSATYYYYNIRNRLLFATRNLTRDDVRRWRRSTVPVACEVLLQGGRRQLLQSVSPLRAAARGARDGLRLSAPWRRASRPEAAASR